MTDTNRCTDARTRWILAVALMLVGALLIVGSNLWFWGFVAFRRDELVQIPVPGEAAVTFAAAGDFTVIYETRGVSNGVPYRATQPNVDPVVKMRDSDGTVTGLAPISFRSTYSFPGSEGRTFGMLPVVRPGTALVVVADAATSRPSGGTVIIKPPFDFGNLAVLLACVVAGGFTTLAGLVLGIVRLVGR